MSELLEVTVTGIEDHKDPIIVNTEEVGTLQFKRGMLKADRVHALKVLSRCERDGVPCQIRMNRQPKQSGGAHTLLGVERFKRH